MKNCKDPSSIEIISEVEPATEAESAADAEQAAVVSPGESTYQQACSVCHAAGVGDAPIPGDSAAWSDRLSKGRDLLVASALSGIGIMPPKGGHSQLSDDDVAAAVDFIIAQSAQ
jgi:cytochrome c5